MDLFNAIDGNGKLATFMSTENVVSIMASKKESMEAICYMIEPFAAMIASETAMTIVLDSKIAVDVIVEGITNAVNSETVLSNIKENLTSIEGALPSIANMETVITEVANVKGNVIDVVTSLQKVTSQSDVLAANIDALFESETLVTMLFNSSSVISALYNNAESIEPQFLKYSSVIMSAALKSKYYKQVDGANQQGNHNVTLYTGKALVLECKSDGGNYGDNWGQFIVGTNTVRFDSDNIYHQVIKFANGITMQGSYGRSGISVRFLEVS